MLGCVLKLHKVAYLCTDVRLALSFLDVICKTGLDKRISTAAPVLQDR